jgi:3-deoxy-manno-octulosonate cytidylyltransferase (CMP-KDO synthetase)
MYRIVIPARYASTRLPGKPLLKLAGKPLIQWVYERACRSSATEVLVATDDERIAAVVGEFGAPVVMTSILHASGTDRIAEVAALRQWGDEEIIVNLQGDEPLMPETLIDQAAGLLETHPRAAIGTLAARITSLGAYMDPNVVKVVADASQRALYFSRAPIPWHRDAAPAGLSSQRSYNHARRHIGIYAYRCGALRQLAAIAPTVLEQLEKLEQLRALEQGFDIRVADACALPGPDVNTPDDVALVETMLA